MKRLKFPVAVALALACAATTSAQHRPQQHRHQSQPQHQQSPNDQLGLQILQGIAQGLSQGQNPGGGRPNSSWVQTVPTYTYDDGIRIQTGTQQVINPGSIIRDLAPLITQPQRPPQGQYPLPQQQIPQQQLPQQQVQYVVPQPQTVQPVVTQSPAVTPKKNVVPKITKPVALTNNSLSLSAKVATKAYSRDVSLRLFQDVGQSLGELQQGLEDAQVILSEKSRQDMADNLRQSGVPEQKIQALMDALKANDPQAIQAAASAVQLDTIYMNPDLTNSLLTGANIGKQMDALNTAIQNGATPEQISLQAGQLAASVQQLNLPQVLQVGLLDQIDQVVNSMDALNGIANGTPMGPGGMMVDVPTGVDCPIIYDPNLPSGTMCVLPGGVVSVGTDANTPMQVVNGSVASAMGLPVAEAPPVEDAEGTAPILGGNGVNVTNPAETGETVSYVLGGQSYTLAAGKTQVHGTTNEVIEFDRGGSFGQARFTLDQGTFRFVATEQGWSIVKKLFSVTVDNSENPNEFHYAFNNELVTVAAGQTQTHKSSTKPVLRFDRSGDGVEARKELDPGTYRVAVDPDTNQWDLFPATAPLAKKVMPVKKVTLAKASKPLTPRK